MLKNRLVHLLASLWQGWLLAVAVAAALVVGGAGFAQAAEPAASSKASVPAKIKIGTYYFPGWKPGSGRKADPWAQIKSFPERKPELGWYSDDDPKVLDQQWKWMLEYGINYVVFDWYWGGHYPAYDHSLKTYLESPHSADLQFSVLWANHDEAPRSKNEFTLMVRYWLAQYFKRPSYLKIEGKPVVFVFSHEALEAKARKFGSSAKELIEAGDEMAKADGLPGIYFVANSISKGNVADFGYSAMSAYNYHGLSRESESYKELIKDYKDIWPRSARKSRTPHYIVPLTQGWDRRPWGGSKNPRHDNSGGTPELFREHVADARKFIQDNQEMTQGMAVICCWNEYGEGSYIEPSAKYGKRFLEALRLFR